MNALDPPPVKERTDDELCAAVKGCKPHGMIEVTSSELARLRKMNIREKMARAMTAIQSSCGRELTCRGAEPCSCTMDVVDAALDALTANPGGVVLREGCSAGNSDQLRPLDIHLVDAATVFVAMIRAIKEGK